MAVVFDIRNAGNLDQANLLRLGPPYTRVDKSPGKEISSTCRVSRSTGSSLRPAASRTPTGPGAGAVRRTLTMRVPMTAPSLTTPAMEVWNWIYTHRTGFVCDMSILQSVTLMSPLYVRGQPLPAQRSEDRSRAPHRRRQPRSAEPANERGHLDQSAEQDREDRRRMPLEQQRRRRRGSFPARQSPGRRAPRSTSTPRSSRPATRCRADAYSPIDQLAGCLVGGGARTGRPARRGRRAGTSTALPGRITRGETQSGTVPIFDTMTATGAPDGFNNSVPGVFNLTPTGSYSCDAPGLAELGQWHEDADHRRHRLHRRQRDGETTGRR